MTNSRAESRDSPDVASVDTGQQKSAHMGDTLDSAEASTAFLVSV